MMGIAFVETVFDDHFRAAYAGIHDDERAATATAVLRHAVAWSSDRGATGRRVLFEVEATLVDHPVVVDALLRNPMGKVQKKLLGK